ncbi:hypothetical protein I4U23_000218 [Adineta vaga]|nr:hypothetical protein I4U23_000218 [Adineta vaga]
MSSVINQQQRVFFASCAFDNVSCDDDSQCCPGCTCRYGDRPYAEVYNTDYNALINGGVCRGNNGNRSCPLCIASGDACTKDGLPCCYSTCTNGRYTRIADVCYGFVGSCYDYDNNCAIGGNFACYDPDRRYANLYPIEIGCCNPDGSDATRPQTINGKLYTTVTQCKSGPYDGNKRYCYYL